MNLNTLLITFGFFASIIFAMSIGYIIAGKKLQGSCGGLGKLMGKDCDFCEKKDQCKKDEG
tara:strand:+ start:466 stop:648 length:183 start_codon:yes stop_codon:yes gene_type:complete